MIGRGGGGQFSGNDIRICVSLMVYLNLVYLSRMGARTK